MSNFLNLAVAGLTSGAIYGILGALLAVWFRVCHVLNLAVGDFAMVGAIATAELVQTHHVNTALAILIVLAIAAAIAWTFDWVVLHFAFDRSQRHEHGVVSVFFYTFGLSLLMEGAGRLIFGTDVHAAPTLWAGPVLHVFDFNVPRPAVLVIGLAALSGAGLWAYLKFTVSGVAASASGESQLGSRIVGIDSARFRRHILIFTAMLAALFGIVESPLSGFTYTSGSTIGVIGVVAAGFASFRKPGRAVAVGVAIGLAESMIGGYVSTSYNEVILYGAIFAIIVLRPQTLGLRAVVL